MKANKTRKKEAAELNASDNAIQKKDRIINIIVFSVVLFIAVLMLSQIA
ncbi:hypothetical protein [Flavobacterium cerinum]|nr:hypothetical protein [Flavobacterium cerinum]